MTGSCCSPQHEREPGGREPEPGGREPEPGGREPTRIGLTSSADTHREEQCRIPAGTFRMGDASGDGIPEDGELPIRSVMLDEFEIDATAVTNAAFGKFVDSTGYITDAERFGSSAVFHLLVAAEGADILGQHANTPWWARVRGADWRHPGGRHSSVDGFEEHPVVHMSWFDAEQYCAWAGRALPTEAQWERAARGGLEGLRHPWGDDPIDGSDGEFRANVFQGSFPMHNTGADGWIGTAPVRTYQPNEFGLWQPIGNVWEWCADWFAVDSYTRDATANPHGPLDGEERVLRGGSYLCHPSYCNRYRNSARSRNTPASSMGNAGFRTVSRSGPGPQSDPARSVQ